MTAINARLREERRLVDRNKNKLTYTIRLKVGMRNAAVPTGATRIAVRAGHFTESSACHGDPATA